MKKISTILLTLLSFNVYAQINSQESNATTRNSLLNRTSSTNNICISMAEEISKMKLYVADQNDRTVDFLKNKEIYVKTAAEWVRVCGSIK